MECLLPLLILINCLIINGVLEWTIVGKVTEYGQNVTLFCNVSNCCHKYAGWDRWTPVQQTLFIDVKTKRPNKKYDGKVLKDGYTLIIQNLTKKDLNVSYSCVYGAALGERKYLLEEDVFKSISPTQPNVPNSQLSQGEIFALITGVIALVLGSVTISIYCWRRQIERNRSKEKVDTLDLNDKLLDEETEEKELVNNSDLKEKLIKIETEQEQCIPKNIRDTNTNRRLEKKDKMFVSTVASDYVIKCLQKNSCVTLTGPSGVGKSFISRHTALTLEKNGYNIITVYSPTDIRDYYQPGKQTVFIVDDICGTFTANHQQIENWKLLLPVINTIISDEFCKIIVSCRLQVYKDEKFNILSPFKSCECNLISDKLGLTSTEKATIAKKYIGTNMNDIGEVSQNCDFFPLLCSLYHEKRNLDVKEFFKNPFDVYKSDLDKLSEHGDEGNYKLCSLALCVLFNNQLEEKFFLGKVTDEQRHIIEDACNACDINRRKSKVKLKKALDTLDGTFICKQNGIYRTVHDKLFDFLAHYFGKKMLDCLIDHGDSGLVHERFIWQKSPDDKKSNIDFIIEIQNDYLESYLQRFIKDWLAGKVTVVFSNNNMEVSSFRQKLLENLKQLNKSMRVTLTNTKDTVRLKGSCDSGTTPLVWNCYDGYTDMVQWMLGNDVDVDQCRDDGVSGLLMASDKGHTDIVKLLLEKDPDVDLCSTDGRSPLLQASHEGYTDIVKLLLEKNPNADLCNKNGFSPLNCASKEGHTDIVKLLLEKNPDVDLCNNDGCSPLLMASNNGHTDIVKLLLEKDVHVDLCSKDGLSPLLQASQEGHTEIVKLLLEMNPNINLCNNNGRSPLIQASQNGHTDIVKFLIEKDPDVDLCANNGCSPLLMASQNGHTDIVKLLLERNPNVDLCSKDGLSPLLQASQEGHTDIVKLLLEMNPNINLCNNNGCSPLLQASREGHTEIVKLLLEKDPDVDLYDNNGCSPLLMASQNGHTYIVKLLLEKDPNVDICSKDCACPLLQASNNGHTDIVKLLLERNPNVDICSKDGLRPLLQASQEGHTDIVKLLLERNPNVNLCSKDGCSPLLQASQEGHTDIVKLLLERNPNVNLCSKDGCSPLLQASQEGHTDIVKLLLERDPDSCDNEPLSTSYVSNNISNSPSIVKPLMKHKPDINAQTFDGGNALYFSAWNGNLEITHLLLENNADSNICIHSKQYITDEMNKHPNRTLEEEKQGLFDSLVKSTSSRVTEYVKNKSVEYAFDVVAGSSPLHTACFMGRINVVRCLLDYNANINMSKEDGTTPLFYACEVGHQDIVRLLLDKGANIQICRIDEKKPLDIATDNGHTSVVVIVIEHMKKETQFSL